MKVMLDHGIRTHASCFDWADQPLRNPFDGSYYDDRFIKGVVRHPQVSEPLQSNRDAIYTVARLIREGRLTALSYIELISESMKDYLGGKPLDALRSCNIQHAHSPINRSNFFDSGFDGFVRKGGKKDKKMGNLGGSQVEFLEWLVSLDAQAVESIIQTYGGKRLTEFEVESFRKLEWFKEFVERFRTSENYPDAFHIWATERNRIDCFLTLDFKIINTCKQIKKEKNGPQLNALVLSPLELLAELEVDAVDEIPYEFDRFYTIAEVPNLM